MPLFTSPDAPNSLSIGLQADVNGPVRISLTVLNESGVCVAEHRIQTTVEGNCELVGQLVQYLVCGWESGVNTKFLFDGLARKLRVTATRYTRS